MEQTTPIEQIEETVETGEELLSWSQKFLNAYGVKIIESLIILTIGIIIAKLFKKLIKKYFAKENNNASAGGILSETTYIFVVFLSIITALANLGVPVNSFITVLGALGVAVGLSMKDSLSNVASGILILMFKPFRVNDLLTLKDGITATVIEIRVMYTILKKTDGCIVFIPNSMIANTEITNYSSTPIRRIEIRVNISYESDYKKAISLLQNLYASNEKILQDPKPVFGVSAFRDSSVEITAMPWVKTEDYWNTYFELMANIKDLFDKNHIVFPYPQHTVHLENNMKPDTENRKQ